MIIKPTNDPMGLAIAEFHAKGQAERLRVFSPEFDEDEIPVATLFRDFTAMPPIEQKALQLSRGHILDVGAGAGCHALALQQMQKKVTAIDISPLSVETMTKQGVENAIWGDFYQMAGDTVYDTILMLMNGSGIIGRLNRMDAFFEYVRKILAPGGQVLMDSSDIRYVFEDENGEMDIDFGDSYYGELTYQMQYSNVKGSAFPWLYVDFDTLRAFAERNGFTAELMAEGEHYDYLARLKAK